MVSKPKTTAEVAALSCISISLEKTLAICLAKKLESIVFCSSTAAVALPSKTALKDLGSPRSSKIFAQCSLNQHEL